MSQSNKKEKSKNVLRVRSNPEMPEHKVALDLDDLDLALIEIQQEDPFFSYNDFAEKFGVTGVTIRNRIKRLKIGGVIDVVTVINPYKVGFDTFAYIGIKIKVDASPRKLVESLQEVEGVSGIVMVSGGFDFIVTYVCRNMEEYRQFVTEQLRGISEIAAFESFIGLDLYERKFLIGLIS
jgi:Lrp/AsnC family transcriptional regulator, regulator for asnA, asnC and gidA